MGYTNIYEYRVYGELFSYGRFGPTDLPVELYNEKSDILKDAEYTKEWLDSKFGIECPDVRFTIGNLLKLDDKTLIELARCMGINYIKGRNKISRTQKNSLKRSMVNALN